ARLVPAEADLLVEVTNPRQLAESLRGLDLLKQLQTYGPIREQLDSTNARKFYQLLAYFEKELGARWPDLLDQVAGGGIALGVRLGRTPAPALLVVQGKDEKLMARFMKLALDVLEQELARQESKEKPVSGKYGDVETVQVGKGLFLARTGASLLLANQE